MLRIALPLLALLVAATARPAAAAEAADGADLARQVAAASGVEAWSTVGRLSFTWHHQPSGRVRSYDWDVATGSVVVTQGEASVTIPAAGPGEGADDAAIAAHQAFVNDRYWLLFPLHLAWDADLRFEDRGTGPVPQMRSLGEARALAVSYPAEGGYTPGDTYVLYLGADLLPVAWAYHPGGAEAPKLVTSRAGRVAVGGLQLPTRFLLPDGTAFITIDRLDATAAE